MSCFPFSEEPVCRLLQSSRGKSTPFGPRVPEARQNWWGEKLQRRGEVMGPAA